MAVRRGQIDDLASLDNKTPRWIELKKQFDKLVNAERTVLVKNEFDNVYTSNGGSGMNAFTSKAPSSPPASWATT